jgi:hypothetical protein
MVEVAEALVLQQAVWLEEGATIQEALVTRVGGDTHLQIYYVLTGQVRLLCDDKGEQLPDGSAGGGEDGHGGGRGAKPARGEGCLQVEVPQCDVQSLGKEAILCKRLTKPSTK